MAIYDGFAPIYQRGQYLRFSQLLAESVLPEYLTEIGFKGENLLDIACGEGSFAVAMSKLGYKVTGIDQSQRMIDLARERSKADEVQVAFQVEDMRSFSYYEVFDLVTCFFDSLNYMLTIKDMHDVYKNTYQALRPGGYFIFDMNTIYGLSVEWQREETYIQNEAPDFLEIHRHTYDYENQIASVDITIFLKREEGWERVEETHRERGYPIADIQFLLSETGFEIAGMYGSLSKRSEVQNTSPRVFFIVRKPN
jgi:2-polyprenyl-3-methyl-5-hydroxy-6-metoxy-1,4-benzoquinol methylase